MTLADALAELAASTDTSAHHHTDAWRTVSARLDRLCCGDDDARQEALLRVHRYVGDYVGDGQSGGAWLRTIAQNVRITRARHQGNRAMYRALEVPDGYTPGDWIDRCATSAPDDGQRCRETEALAVLLRDVVACVYADGVRHTPRWRRATLARNHATNADAALMLHTEGVKGEELAEAAGVSLDAMHQRLSRGRELAIGALGRMDRPGARGLRTHLEAQRLRRAA